MKQDDTDGRQLFTISLEGEFYAYDIDDAFRTIALHFLAAGDDRVSGEVFTKLLTNIEPKLKKEGM